MTTKEPKFVPARKEKVEVRTSLGELAAFENHANAVGRLVYSWNRLHVNLMGWFASLLEPDEKVPLGLGRTIWHSLRADSAQRAALKAAARYVLVDEPVLQEELVWAVSETEWLAGYRNIAVHMPVHIDFASYSSYGTENEFAYVELDEMLGPDVAAKLAGVEVLEMYRSTQQYTLALSHFVTWLLKIYQPWPFPPPASWPERLDRPPLLAELDRLRSAPQSTAK